MSAPLLPPELVAECEAIAPPCVTLTGRTDAHGTYVCNVGRGMVCWFCGGAVSEAPHHDPKVLLAALAFAEPWALADAPLFLPENTERAGVSETPRDSVSRARRGAL